MPAFVILHHCPSLSSFSILVGLNFVYLTLPFNVHISNAANCQLFAGNSVAAGGIPTTATGVIATISTFSSLRTNHVLFSFGRYSTHYCSPWDSAPYDNNTVLNDVLLSHNGGLGSNYYAGHSHGSHIIPLYGAAVFDVVMSMGWVASNTNYVNIQIYGYTTGGAGYLTQAQISNIRSLTTTVGLQVLNSAVVLPSPWAAVGYIGTISTFITTRNDYYMITFGRNVSHPITNLQDNGMSLDTANYFNDFILTSAGDNGQIDYYGRQHGSHVIPLKANNAFDIYTNIFKNDAIANAYLNIQVYGFIPFPSYTNVRWLTTNQKIIMQSNTGGEIISNSIVPGVPSNATSIFANIYSWQSSRNDFMMHNFGRYANTNPAILDNQMFNAALSNVNAYYNDVIVTYEGRNTTSYYYGYSHGSNIIPLKANAAFDSVLGINKAAASGIHYVLIQVYGYTLRTLIIIHLAVLTSD